MRPAVNDEQHPQHLAWNPARHACQSHDLLAIRYLADLFGDRVGRVVERDCDHRALRPALHDRLQRRRHVAVEGIQDIARDGPAGSKNERVVGVLAPESRPISNQHELYRGEHLVEKTLAGRSLRLAIEKLGAPPAGLDK